MIRSLPVMKAVKVIDHAATGIEIRRLRKESGLRLEDISLATDISIAQLHRLEKGIVDWTPDLLEQINEAIKEKSK